jgi:hypothetical protein
MAGSDKPENGPKSPSVDTDLARSWEIFRRGDVAPCKRDGGPMALSVDGASIAYRFVCVKCGFASPWFEASPTGTMRVRGFGSGDPNATATED